MKHFFNWFSNLIVTETLQGYFRGNKRCSHISYHVLKLKIGNSSFNVLINYSYWSIFYEPSPVILDFKNTLKYIPHFVMLHKV